MHIIAAIIIAAVLLIPAAVAGIRQGLIQCSQHFDELVAAMAQFAPLFEVLFPFGLGLLLMLGGLGVLMLTAWLVYSGLCHARRRSSGIRADSL